MAIAPTSGAGAAGAGVDAVLKAEERERLVDRHHFGVGALADHDDVAVVGGIDALSAADAALIDRYARVRGGSVLLLPEERPQGPAQSLFPGVWKEQLSSTPVAIGPMQAAEVLQGSSLPPATTVLASAGANPVVVSVPRGRGRIAIGGAMDAWRYRDANTSAFDRASPTGSIAGGPRRRLHGPYPFTRSYPSRNVVAGSSTSA